MPLTFSTALLRPVSKISAAKPAHPKSGIPNMIHNGGETWNIVFHSGQVITAHRQNEHITAKNHFIRKFAR